MIRLCVHMMCFHLATSSHCIVYIIYFGPHALHCLQRLSSHCGMNYRIVSLNTCCADIVLGYSHACAHMHETHTAHDHGELANLTIDH